MTTYAAHSWAETCPICARSIFRGSKNCSHKTCRVKIRETFYTRKTKNINESIEITFFSNES